MKKFFYLRAAALGLLMLVSCGRVFSQITIAADSVSCGATSDTLRATLLGDVPTASGITADDGYSSSIPIGFTFNFYGTSHTHVLIGSNGCLCFNLSLAGGYNPWPISAALAGNASAYNTICGPWCDIYIPAGGTITYSSIGTAPYRKFMATWCATRMYSCTTQWTTTQIILYETTDIVEVHLGHKTTCSWNGGHAIIGVQNASGSASTAAPSRDYPTVWSATNEGWRFTPTSSSGSSYTCSSIAYAPVPYSSSTICWYDSATHTFLGTGSTLHFTPSVGDSTVYACAAGCSDSTYCFFHLDLSILGGGSSPVHITSINPISPTVCGVCNGSVALVGINPGILDTVFYSYRGVPQPTIVDSAGADSTLTVHGLCAGYYDYFYVKQGVCPSNSMAVTIVDPPFTIDHVTHTNPSVCGACDGTITLYGLVPGFSDTINFTFNGVPQTAVVFTVPATGTVTLTGLSAGNYAINATMNYCVSPDVTCTLTNPSFGIADTSHTNASCSACDGTFTLYGMPPGQSVTVNYDFNGVPQAPFTGTTTGSGTITVTNLCPGNYDNIIAMLNSCVHGACISNRVGTITVVPPPLIPIALAGNSNPTECGICNGTIKIKGMTPGVVDTIFFNKNGIAQTPAIYATLPDSTITLYGLCAGDYDGFFIKVGPCPTTTITTHVVLTDPPMTAAFTDVIAPGCSGDTVTFTNGSTSAGSLYYTWFFGDGYSGIAANPVHIYPQGTYHVTLIVTNHYCVDSVSTSFTLSHPIQSVFTTSASEVCQNLPVTFTNSSVGTPPTYMWSFGDGATSTVTNPTHAYAYVGTYSVKLIATNYLSCSDSLSKTVVVDSQSVITIALSDTALCSGAVVTMSGTFSGIANTGMVWYFGNGDSIRNTNPVSYAYPAAGTYTVSATANYLTCTSVTATGTVHVFGEPSIYLGEDTSICLGGESSLILADVANASNPNASWIWSTGETTSWIGITSPGCYRATVTIFGCQATDSICVTSDCYMCMPNIFTPDGDGVNDYFYPRSELSKGLTSFKMDIYNRWGQLVFETTSVEGRGWDGKFNSADQPQGVYVYVIDGKFKDGRSEHHQGTITLLR